MRLFLFVLSVNEHLHFIREGTPSNCLYVPQIVHKT